MEEERQTFTLPDENGNPVEYEVLGAFTWAETGKNYLLYSDDEIGENGKLNVFAAVYTLNEDDLELFPIETDDEWAFVEQQLEGLKQQATAPTEE